MRIIKKELVFETNKIMRIKTGTRKQKPGRKEVKKGMNFEKGNS